MALIKMTAIVDAISGKIQGTVFARNKGGAYARGRGVVTNPRTPEQMRVRSIFATVSSSWRNLSEVQISDWNELADETTYQNRLGDSRKYTGKALYQKVNQNRQLMGLGLLSNAPNFTELIGVMSATGSFSLDGDDLSIVFHADLVAELTATPSSGFVLTATPPVGKGMNYVENRARDLVTKIGLDGNEVKEEDFAASAQELGAMYQARFGTPDEEERIVLALTPVNEYGQKGVRFPFILNFQ